MTKRSGMTSAFALALGLGLAGCSDDSGNDPMMARAVGAMETADGDFTCNFSMIGDNLALTSSHCISYYDSSVYVVLDEEGEKVTAEDVDAVGVGALWAVQRDEKAPQDILEDPYYLRSSKDKALVRLDSNIGTVSGVLPLAPLETLQWELIADTPFMKADVSLLTHMPPSGGGPSTRFQYQPCHVYKMEGINEIVAHDCPSRPGVSGSPLVAGAPDTGFAIVALIQSRAVRDHDSPLVKAFSTVIDTDILNFAATVNSLPDFCAQKIQNCAVSQAGTRISSLSLMY